MSEILLIDDSEDYREIIGTILLDAGYVVSEARCPDEAFGLLFGMKFDLILCDLHMPFTLDRHMPEFPYSVEVGVQTIEQLQSALPKTPIIAITASMPSDRETLRDRIEVVPILRKPFPADTLIQAVEWALRDDPRERMH